MPKVEPIRRLPGARPPLDMRERAWIRGGPLNKVLAAMPPADAVDLLAAIVGGGWAIRSALHDHQRGGFVGRCFHVVRWNDPESFSCTWDRVHHQSFVNAITAVLAQYRLSLSGE